MSPGPEDLERLRTVFEDHYGDVFRYLLRRLGRREDAEDVAQSMFVDAQRLLAEMPQEPFVEAFLIKLAWRRLSNYRRALSRRERLQQRMVSLSSTKGHDEWMAADANDDVLVALRRLRFDEQEALFLIYWDGCSHLEAAEIMGIRVGAFNVRLHRARAALVREFTIVVEGKEIPHVLPIEEGQSQGQARRRIQKQVTRRCPTHRRGTHSRS